MGIIYQSNKKASWDINGPWVFAWKIVVSVGILYNGNSFHRSQRFKGSKDCVTVPAAARLVLAHAALKPDRVAAVQGEKTKANGITHINSI